MELRQSYQAFPTSQIYQCRNVKDAWMYRRPVRIVPIPGPTQGGKIKQRNIE